MEAGAEAIITNTYQASVEGYNKYLNFNDEQSIKLIKDTVKLAHVARSTFLKSKGVQSGVQSPLIVGSIVSPSQIFRMTLCFTNIVPACRDHMELTYTMEVSTVEVTQIECRRKPSKTGIAFGSMQF